MPLQALPSPRFVRRTHLGPNEYRKNFHQIDRDVMAAVTSEEADRVTPLMSKIYLRLVNAPDRFWERAGVLRIEAEERGEQLVNAWVVLCELVGVSSATASKALRWMHEQGIIGYFAGKNGVGVRIFLNRAASSIGSRAGQKILEFSRASSRESRASTNEAAFSDSFADLEISDTGINPRAPNHGAKQTMAVNKHLDPDRARSEDMQRSVVSENVPSSQTAPPIEVPVEMIVSRLREELEPSLHSAARRAAAEEHELTREWLENRGLPKAARVAQHEAYNVLRKYGVISESSRPPRSQSEVGRNINAPPSSQPFSEEEVSEFAQACVAMFETKGQSIEVTLSEMSSEAGGFLLPEDAGRVRERANLLISASDGGAEK